VPKFELDDEEREPPPGWGGLAPLVAMVVAMIAVWFAVNHLKDLPSAAGDGTGVFGVSESEDDFRRAYVAALSRASSSGSADERRAAEEEVRDRRRGAVGRPGGVDALDAWVRDEIARAAAGTASAP